MARERKEVAVVAVSGEPVSLRQIPCATGKCRECWPNASTCTPFRVGKARIFRSFSYPIPCGSEQGISASDAGIEAPIFFVHLAVQVEILRPLEKSPECCRSNDGCARWFRPGASRYFTLDINPKPGCLTLEYSHSGEVVRINGLKLLAAGALVARPDLTSGKRAARVGAFG